jgi:hypothetical protein
VKRDNLYSNNNNNSGDVLLRCNYVPKIVGYISKPRFGCDP